MGPFSYVIHVDREYLVCTGIEIDYGSTEDKLLIKVEVTRIKWGDYNFECLDVKAGKKIYPNMIADEKVLKNEVEENLWAT